MTSTNELILHPGREKSILHHHPWVFSGAVANTLGSPESGEPVLVKSAAGEPLGWASYSPSSQIRARMWSFTSEERIDADMLELRILRSFSVRKTHPKFWNSDAWRMIFAESDGIPGLIVDQYANILVVQLLSAGAEYFRFSIVDILAGMSGVQAVYERSDVEVRKLEGLPTRKGLLSGLLSDKVTIISENGLKFLVDIQGGQKTGYYLDQRDNRLLVQTYAGGADVLDCFSYTGGFSIHALKGGAKSVHSVDSAGEALEILKGNQTLNEFDLRESTQIQADVFFQLRKFRDEGRKFDLIILDPPKFASISSHVPKAARAYKDINLLAFKLLRPNGYLFTFSCSGGVSHDLFGKIVAGAALDAKVNAKILHNLSQSIDHPIHLAFPESEYLKGLVVQVM